MAENVWMLIEKICHGRNLPLLWNAGETGRPVLMWEHNGLVCVLRSQADDGVLHDLRRKMHAENPESR